LGPRAERKGGKTDHPEPPVKKEIRGLLLLFMAVVLGGSLFSYHPADLTFLNTTGPLGEAHNLFGTVGAHLSGILFLLLGFSAYWFVIMCAGLSFLSFRGRRISSPIGSFIAATALLFSSSALLNLYLPEGVTFRGVAIEPGGLAGLILSESARRFLNDFGACVFLIAVFVVARVTIVEPKPEPRKKPTQARFPFMNRAGDLQLPSLDLLNDPPEKRNRQVQRESLEMNARRVEKKLADFGVEGEVSEILPGPVITLYEFKPAAGVKISKVAGLSDDLALTLRAPSIRIVAPIPGKAAIGIEIPNNQREMVFLKEVLSSPAYTDTRHKLPIALGKDIVGGAFITDLAKMPHLLVAGATGAGKSVSINAMIQSLLFKVSPEAVRFLMIDPKRIELSIYQDIPHLLHPVVTDPKEATKALRWAVAEMERRYMLLSDRGVRNIESYNRKVAKQQKADADTENRGEDRHLPYIVLVIDELADLMMASSREVEEGITRLAQMARAAGIHLIIATQRPSVDVLTGVIKANFPARISFQVSSKVDSRTILDTVGAEHLLGEGDMLFLPPGVSRITRIHGAYISEEEIRRVTEFLKSQKKPEYDSTILTEIARSDPAEDGELELDEKYDQAVEVVIQSGQASISMLQRKLRVGYNRAARMIEAMEIEGIVGPSDGVRPREVYGRKTDGT